VTQATWYATCERRRTVLYRQAVGQEARLETLVERERNGRRLSLCLWTAVQGLELGTNRNADAAANEAAVA
jgi:hypothetical protein